MSSSRSHVRSAFDYKSPADSEVKEKPAFRHPPGTVTRKDIDSLDKLRDAFKASSGQPLQLIESKGGRGASRVVCKIFMATADIPNPAYRRHLSTMVSSNFAHFVKMMGPEGVTEIVAKGVSFTQSGEDGAVRVAYFTGKDFELIKT